MHLRFLKVFVLVALAAAAFAGIARALDFDDEDIPPPKGEVGAVYDFKVLAHAGCLPYHFQIDSGELPPGLTLSDLDYSTGLISGTPTQAGTYSAWLSLHDCAGKSAQELFEFDIAPRTWGIKTTALPEAVAGAPYSTTLQAGDHPTTVVTWRITSGLLPAGLVLGADGTISGTPLNAGSSTFTITATSSDTSSVTRTDSKQFTLNVVALTVSLTRNVGEVGVHYSSSLNASGGQAPYRWSANGGLPAGLSIASDGTVSGVPRQAGSFTLTAHVVDASGAARDVRLPLVVQARLAIATKKLRAASEGHRYNAKVSARGGVAPIRWSVVHAPRGLKFGSRTGIFAGTATVKGTFHVVVRVRDALGARATKTFVLTVR
jgi:large repetitive protein